MLQIRQVENLLPVYDNSLLAALGEKATAIYHLQQCVEYLSDSEEERQSIRNGILTKLLELHYLSKQAKCKKRMFRRLSTVYNVIPDAEIPVLMFWQVVLKTSYEIIALPITIRVVKFVKNYEQEDVYDNSISYNILKIFNL